MAGLLTAAALTDFCPEVVVVDRDTLPQGTKDRKGTPQGRHAHALLARGQRVLEQIFPGFTEELVDAGAWTSPPAYRTRRMPATRVPTPAESRKATSERSR